MSEESGSGESGVGSGVHFWTAPDGYACREFRPEDGLIEGVLIDHPIIGGTMEKDGIPVAYAGVNTIAERHWVFFLVRDGKGEGLRRHGLWLVRLMRDGIAMVRNAGITEVYALCDLTKPDAERFLRRLGFAPMAEMAKPADVLIYEKLMGAKAWRMELG